MNRVNNTLRDVFQRMNNSGSSITAIAVAIGKTTQTVRNLKKIETGKLFELPSKSTRKPTFDVEALKKHIEDNPFDFDRERGKVFGKHKTTIQRWRSKLGFKRKKAKTTYREADEDLKKTLNHF